MTVQIKTHDGSATEALLLYPLPRMDQVVVFCASVHPLTLFPSLTQIMALIPLVLCTSLSSHSTCPPPLVLFFLLLVLHLFLLLPSYFLLLLPSLIVSPISSASFSRYLQLSVSPSPSCTYVQRGITEGVEKGYVGEVVTNGKETHT